MSGSRSKLPIAALAALLLATAGFFTYLLREAAAKDDAAPVIVCSSSEIHVSVDASEEELRHYFIGRYREHFIVC